jgi:pSer/pThr/pTyr-binding forkhead associated (FHA) protein
LIGRSKECDLRASSELVSRRHCEFILKAKSLRVRDLASKNGTFVNGVRIEEEIELAGGDRLQIGPLRFEVIAPTLNTPVEQLASQESEAATHASPSPSRGQIVVPPAAGDDQYADDISQWLEEPTASGRSVDTEAGNLDDTRHVGSSGTRTTDSMAPGKGVPQANTSAKEEKKKPGKLPPVPVSRARDSREAAENILKGIPRRR